MQFTDDNGKKSNMHNIEKPFDLNLEMRDGYDNIIFDKSILGYAMNPNMFIEDDTAWTHFKVPISEDLYEVSYLRFYVGILTKNKVKLKNMYLSKSSELDPYICSGKDDEVRNSWLTSFDDGFVGGYVNAKRMCKEHYGSNAWLGGDNVIEEAIYDEYHCCGDDKNEYFLGASADDVFS
tara:strand:- start:118 stop:654 length:537 start_codon:yes stop_codon:yes gene_type:complete